ncbi:MAG: TRAP transporter small permease subunit [Bacteriovoracaceae bacterium]|nr:TRAP transporter small permease subunit [Bacteriovoracaceae bacterium]
MWLKRINHWFDKAILKILILVILSLLLFSCWSIVSRLMHSTNLWAEPLMRHLVFLSLFLGATIAVANDQHIRMDLLTRYLEIRGFKKTESCLMIVLYLSCVVFLGFLVYASWDYYLVEKATESEAFLFFKLHHVLLTIPFGLSLMAFRFFTHALDKCLTLFLVNPTGKHKVRRDLV